MTHTYPINFFQIFLLLYPKLFCIKHSTLQTQTVGKAASQATFREKKKDRNKYRPGVSGNHFHNEPACFISQANIGHFLGSLKLRDEL